MLIISVRDNEKNRWKRNAKTKKPKKPPKNKNKKKQRQKRKRGTDADTIVEVGELNDFVVHLSYVFPQLICKTLSLSIFLKQRELYESKHVAMECRCSKIWDLLSFLICSSILVLKWRHVSPIKLKLQLAQVNLYTRKYFKSSGIGSLFEK